MNDFPILDARPSEDPRNQFYLYPVSASAASSPRERKLYKPGPILDQGREGACVGFACTNELLSSPVRAKKRVQSHQGDRFAQRTYRTARRLYDPWEGEDYEGTSLEAGAKVLQKKFGFVDGYEWVYSAEAVIQALLTDGPVVMCVPWFYDMYWADDGEVKIGGNNVGFHAILINGYHPSRNGVESLRWFNSWGPGYGVNGMAWVSVADFAEHLCDPNAGSGELATGGQGLVFTGRKRATIPLPRKEARR